MTKEQFIDLINKSKTPVHELYSRPIAGLKFFGPKWAKDIFDLAPLMNRETEDEKKIFCTVMEMAAAVRDMCNNIPDDKVEDS